MNKALTTLSALGLGLLAGPGLAADSIGGVARMDFRTNELTIPCVHLQNFDGKNNNMFFDVVLQRRGNSFNFELSLAEPEDTAFCQRLADFANFEDDDLEGDDDGIEAARMLIRCKATETRSRVAVVARNLEEGDYTVELVSGTSSVESGIEESDDGEAEFRFDSDLAAIDKGATELDPAFIQEGALTARLIAFNGETVLQVEAVCSAN